jgi:hypothetical protein
VTIHAVDERIEAHLHMAMRWKRHLSALKIAAEHQSGYDVKLTMHLVQYHWLEFCQPR